MKCPSCECLMTFRNPTSYSDFQIDQTLHQFYDLISNLLHILSKLYDVPVDFVPLIWGSVLLYLRSSKDASCLISNDLPCSYGGFPLIIYNGCYIPAGKAYPSGYLIPSVFVTEFAHIVETENSQICNLFGLFTWKIPPNVLEFPLDIIKVQWTANVDRAEKKVCCYCL